MYIVRLIHTKHRRSKIMYKNNMIKNSEIVNKKENRTIYLIFIRRKEKQFLYQNEHLELS